jgi:hypothetical protein
MARLLSSLLKASTVPPPRVSMVRLLSSSMVPLLSSPLNSSSTEPHPNSLPSSSMEPHPSSLPSSMAHLPRVNTEPLLKANSLLSSSSTAPLAKLLLATPLSSSSSSSMAIVEGNRDKLGRL